MIPESLYIDATAVSKRKLYTGDMIPAVGLGTFGSDNYDNDTIAQAVDTAL